MRHPKRRHQPASVPIETVLDLDPAARKLDQLLVQAGWSRPARVYPRLTGRDQVSVRIVWRNRQAGASVVQCLRFAVAGVGHG